jgi:uncharacterized protein (TIGR02246 family)
MRSFAIATLMSGLLVAAVGTAAVRGGQEPGQAASKDEEVVKRLMSELWGAWKGHDMKAFCGRFAEDADFVNRFGQWYRGRAVIQDHLTWLHKNIFNREIGGSPTDTIRFIAPGVAVVHQASESEGMKYLVTYLLASRDGRWLVQTANVSLVVNPTGAPRAPAVSATVPTAADEVKGDLKKLQGKWTHRASNGDKVTYTFEGKKLKVVAPTREYGITVTVDESAKPAKTIDLQIVDAPDDLSKDKTSKGIYRFDGDDKLIWCFSPLGDRPTKYEQVGFEQILSELTRVKD